MPENKLLGLCSMHRSGRQQAELYSIISRHQKAMLIVETHFKGRASLAAPDPLRKEGLQKQCSKVFGQEF